MPPTQTLPPRVLRLVRLALLGGTLLVGAVFWGMVTSGAVEPILDGEAAGVFRLVFVAVLIGVAGGLLWLRRRREQAGAKRQASYCIVAWALGESVAMVGGLYLLLTGDPLLYLAGLIAFGIAWLLFPIPAEAPSA